MNDLQVSQRQVCQRFGAAFTAAPLDQIAGVARAVGFALQPLHGLRHPITEGTTGWYLWAGDYSEARDFFEPLHVSHLATRAPVALPYLALPPGWRFLLAPDYEDVWFDPTLLDV